MKSDFTSLTWTPPKSIAGARLTTVEDLTVRVDDVETTRARLTLSCVVDKLSAVLTNFGIIDNHLPLWWYDRWYCHTSVRDLDPAPSAPASVVAVSASTELWRCLRGAESAYDLWLMFTESPVGGGRYIYVSVEGGCDSTVRYLRTSRRLPSEVVREPFRSDMCSLVKRNIISLTNTASSEVGTASAVTARLYELDMGGDYALQTRSTPFIISSIEGSIRYLCNRDSDCSPVQNRLTFVTVVGVEVDDRPVLRAQPAQRCCVYRFPADDWNVRSYDVCAQRTYSRGYHTA